MEGLVKMLSGAWLLFLIASCGGSADRTSDDAAASEEPAYRQDILTGSMAVVVDESVSPLMQEQADVFRSSYTSSSIRYIVQPERLAVNSLLQGEAAVAVLARTLTTEESMAFEQRAISPRIFPIAYDGIVLVANKSDGDSTILVSQIKQWMSGEKSTRSGKLIFSSVNSSTFRFLKELVEIDRVSAGGAEEVGEVDEVLHRVATSSGSVGVISYNQYLAKRDTLDIFENLRILSVRNDLDADAGPGFYKPSQNSLGDNTYPLKQTIYVLNYQPNLGLGIGFSAFLTGDRGQRVVLKSGLLPATMPGREIIIRDNINY